MKAECSNGTSGTGVIGTDAAPGDGTITVSGTCTPPIRITAVSTGFMRPLGSTTNVTYDPAVNLPISNMLGALPTTTVPATANPVTTLVADKVAATNATFDATTAAAILLALPTEQASVAASLGIADTDGDYRVPAIAAASTRIAQVVALAVQQAALAPPTAVTTGTKTLGQFVAEKIAAAATGAGTLNNAANMAAKLNTGADANAGKIDVTTNAKITGANTVTGSIDRDAALVQAIVATVANSNGVVGASVAELLTQINDSTDVNVTGGVAEHIQAAKFNDISNKAVQLVMKAQANATDNANSATAVKTEADTRLAAVRAAVLKVNNALTAALAGSASATAANDALAHYGTVLGGVETALSNDAAATTKVFAAPPTVGVVAAVDALVANIERQTNAVTAGGTAPSAAALAGYATTALTVTRAIADLAAPPVPGTAGATQTDADAYRAAIAAMATKLGDAAGTVDKVALQTSVNSLKTATQVQLNGVTSTHVDVVELAQKAAEAALVSAPNNFTTPPTPGTVAVVTPPTPPAAGNAPPDVPMTVVTKAQQDEAIAQGAKATTAATAAATQATAAATAASAASAATTVAAAQTAANDAQAAATEAHKARVDADAASAAAAKAYPNSPAATAAADRAAAAATADSAAAASAAAATASYNTLVATLQAEQLAAAQAAQAAAETAAGTAAAKAQEAAGFPTSALAATAAAEAQTAADGAQAAATAAQT
ncbi:MAG: hypothetical protein PHH58_14405, partial [Rhodoferax sp.]|nr:hypothetical protein [Rhodoferax sp.]